MTLLIRIGWFILTFALYLPSRNALDARSLPAPIILTFHLVYLLFVVIVPSNAFVAMWKKRSTNKADILIRYMWSLVQDYCQLTNSPQTLGFQIHIIAALYYSIFDILQQSGLEPKVRASFYAVTYKTFDIAPSDTNSQLGISNAFSTILHIFREDSPNPCTHDGLDKILGTALLLAAPDEDGAIDNVAFFETHVFNRMDVSSFQEKVASLRLYASKLLLSE